MTAVISACILKNFLKLVNFCVCRIFKRMGLSTISVKADTGAMGGSGSEEFMVESEVGDDTLILCPKCGYAANIEKAACKPDVALDKDGNPQVATDKSVEEIPTPDVKTIDDLAAFLQTTSNYCLSN